MLYSLEEALKCQSPNQGWHNQQLCLHQWHPDLKQVWHAT
jgi:hypothetical protein